MKTMFCKTESLKELMVRIKHVMEIEETSVAQEYLKHILKKWTHLTYSTDLLFLCAEGITNLTPKKFWLHIEHK